MYAKIAALGLAALGVTAAAGRDWLARGQAIDSTPRMVLAPPAVGAWKQTAQWLYPYAMGQFQEYAQYAGDGLLVTLSFDHNRLSAHNALDCFRIKGEMTAPPTVRSFKTLDGNARFNLARFDSGAAMSLVAASQCLAGSCIENPPPAGWAELASLSFWSEALFKPAYGAIPVNINIAIDPGHAASATQPTPADLEQALGSFIAQLDLDPARRQAQIESGATRP